MLGMTLVSELPTMTWRYLILILILGEALVGVMLLWYRQRTARRLSR
jgi:hypothetical protein